MSSRAMSNIKTDTTVYNSKLQLTINPNTGLSIRHLTLTTREAVTTPTSIENHRFRAD